MKIAALTITYNDDYKIEEWYNHYQTYKDELFLHIIIDNSSENKYLQAVESIFSDSIIIKRNSNGGCTNAYNDGIKLAMSYKEVDSIMLIGNDIKLEKGGITKLHNFLFSDKDYGMVAPILFSKDSKIIEDYGCMVNDFLIMKPRFDGELLEHIDFSKVQYEVEAVTGGMNLSKREFYEKVGYQDEKLFMYSDEVDIAIRAKKNKFKLAVTNEVYAWHNHINPSGRKLRNYIAPFLSARNKVYLSRKHFNTYRSVLVFFYFIILFFYNVIKSNFKIELIKYNFWYVIGASYGMLRKMRIPTKLI